VNVHLWQVSGLDLSLVPTHPDRVGGLGFLANTVYAFMPLEELLKQLFSIRHVELSPLPRA
jgi:hypothetical protein